MAPMSCIRPLLVMVYIYSLYDASLLVRVSKYNVIPDRGIETLYVPTISFNANSLIICASGFHSREDACYASYHDDICQIYTSGCCPLSDVWKEGSLLLQRNLSGLGRNNEDCSHHKAASRPTGVYTIYPYGIPNGISVYCDMDTDEGGWTVIQQRFDGSVDFYRTWDDYRDGFGNVSGEHWLGNENIYKMVRWNNYLLRVDLGAADGEQKNATYYTFTIADEIDQYRLNIGGYCGDAGDDGVYGLTYNDDSVFSTKDRDNTSNISGNKCSEEAHSGWWFKNCTNVNLNGLWGPGEAGTGGKLVHWYPFKLYEGLANTTLKIRRK